uniref:Transferrin-like domain-containing protein n=1 Tax=Salvator merianae TaxID=96440 RepID=A0A8D0EAQ5_SALMN
MKLALQATLSFGLLAFCLATSPVRWCTISGPEQVKCQRLQGCLSSQENLPPLSCVRKIDHSDCIKAIANNEADFISLDGGHIFEASLNPYKLKPILAEAYRAENGELHTSYLAVAVVKKGTVESLDHLGGKKSCHTGWGRSVGWVIAVGTQVSRGQIVWPGAVPEKLEKAVARYFLGSCVPGVPKDEALINLCRLCAGKGAEKCSRNDPYSGYSGAFECLRSGGGDVAYVKEATVLALSPEERSQYELLCLDGSKAPIEAYEACNLGRVPAHAIVARSIDGREDDIQKVLLKAVELGSRNAACQLFGPPEGTLRDLLVKDSAVDLFPVPKIMDAQLYLGLPYYTAIQSLRRERPDPDATERVVWCAVGKAEKTKCDSWSGVSKGAIECAVAETIEECIIKIQKADADAVSVDGGQIYIGGKCGLVPVLAEVYSEPDICNNPRRETKVKGYSAVAVVKKTNRDISWNNLEGKKSCHTGVDRNAGWNIPFGLIYKAHNTTCDFSKFFSEGCAPGSSPDSNLCKLCKGSGSGDALAEKYKCKANSNEIYFGYTGAFRCLIEEGDVAFIKHNIANDIINGENKPSWVGNYRIEDFEKLCLNGQRSPVTDYDQCNLADVPTHGVITRPERAEVVKKVLLEQQALYGSNGSKKDVFQMFQSETKDSLFKDGTLCLAVAAGKNYKTYLGKEYLDSVDGFKKCAPSELLKACTFHQHN